MSNILITFNCIIYLSIIKYYINVLILEVHAVTYTIYIYIYIIYYDIYMYVLFVIVIFSYVYITLFIEYKLLLKYILIIFNFNKQNFNKNFVLNVYWLSTHFSSVFIAHF